MDITVKSHYVASSVNKIPGREIHVVLPPFYYDFEDYFYPVVYLQDGQNCFDYDPFGHGGWQVDKTIYRLIFENAIEPVVAVLVPNSGGEGDITRTKEYTPIKYRNDGGMADSYINYLISDVLPFVEGNYRIRSSPKNRAIGGSSLGGIFSFYTTWFYSEYFAKGIVMSPSFWWGEGWMLEQVKKTPISEVPEVKIYMDSGGVHKIQNGEKISMSDDGKFLAIVMRDLLLSKGFELDESLKHHVEEGHIHNEGCWRERFHLPMRFLFSKKLAEKTYHDDKYEQFISVY